MTITRPLLAVAIQPEQLDDLNYDRGVFVSDKLDGIRCLIHPDLGPVTRSFKPIRNEYIREMLAEQGLEGFDGEITIHHDNGEMMTFNEIQSAVMTSVGCPNFKYWVFDDFAHPDVFRNRITDYRRRIQLKSPMVQQWLKPHQQHQVGSSEAIEALFESALCAGQEGIMIRYGDVQYKSGRSTLRQGILLKYKPVASAEGTVINFVEKLHNDNPAEEDELGLTKRSHVKDNMIPAGTLGALVILTEWGEVHLGSGFTEVERKRIWDNQGKYRGSTVTFEYQKHGMQDKPRFPIFKGFRHKDDT